MWLVCQYRPLLMNIKNVIYVLTYVGCLCQCHFVGAIVASLMLTSLHKWCIMMLTGNFYVTCFLYLSSVCRCPVFTLLWMADILVGHFVTKLLKIEGLLKRNKCNKSFFGFHKKPVIFYVWHHMTQYCLSFIVFALAIIISISVSVVCSGNTRKVTLWYSK